MRAWVRVAVGLAWRNIRRRPGASLLLLAALILATTTLSVSLTMEATADAPWDRTWAATRGPHVIAYGLPGADLRALAAAPGVVASAGPWPVAFVHGRVGRRPMEMIVIGRDQVPSPVDQPLVTAGTWVRSDGIVFERSFAEAIHVEVGDRVSMAGRSLTVRGIAVSATESGYPLSVPGKVWATRATDALGGAARSAGSQLALRLADPAAAPAFAAAHGDGLGDLASWQELRRSSHPDVNNAGIALTTASILLALLTMASISSLVAGRMAERSRQVAALKAVGVTPAQVGAVLLLEYLALAAPATLVGLFAGTVLAPRLTRSAVTLLGAPGVPPITWSHAAVVAGVAVAVIVIATIRPVVHGARHSTVRSLAADVRRPVRMERLGRLAALVRLPVPAVMGVRATMRRPSRTLLGVASLTLCVATVVAALTVGRAYQVARVAAPPRGMAPESIAAVQAVDDQLRAVVYGLAAVLLILGVLNLLIVSAFSARDGARNHAILRAVGMTPRQTVASLVTAQVVASLPACLAGIPLGILIFRLADAAGGGTRAPVSAPPILWLGAVLVAAPILTALLAAGPARLLARRPVAPLLTYE